MIEVFKYTQEIDKATAPLMIAAMLGSIVVGIGVSWLIFKNLWYGIFLGLAVGLLVGRLILASKSERAGFSRLKGQPWEELASMQTTRACVISYYAPVLGDPLYHICVH